MHYLSLVYFVNQPLHVLGIFLAHHQEVYCIYTVYKQHWYVLCFSVDCLLAGLKWNGLLICPKHVEVDWRNKLRINSASIWFLLRRYSCFSCLLISKPILRYHYCIFVSFSSGGNIFFCHFEHTYHSFVFCLHIVSPLSRDYFFFFCSFRVVTDALKAAEVGVACVCCKGEMRNEVTLYSENVMGRVRLEDLNTYEGKSIKWTLKYVF